MGAQLSAYCPTDQLGLPQLASSGSRSFASKFDVDDSVAIGSGKFSEVFLCWRKNRPEQRFAVKVINIRNEDHQACGFEVRVVLELCEGGELYDRIQQRGHYPEKEAILLVGNLLEAVAFVHSKGIMHRDLKPENILLVHKSSHTDIKISDFGLAKMSRDYPRRLPRSNSICGSDFYLAPEVIKQEEYGREIDVWSVGIVSYVLLSGSLPFFHSVLHKLYRQIVERDISFSGSNWSNVSSGAQDFILRLLQIRPGDRLTAETALNHPWLRRTTSESFCVGPQSAMQAYRA
eukprot:g5087.t1